MLAFKSMFISLALSFEFYFFMYRCETYALVGWTTSLSPLYSKEVQLSSKRANCQVPCQRPALPVITSATGLLAHLRLVFKLLPITLAYLHWVVHKTLKFVASFSVSGHLDIDGGILRWILWYSCWLNLFFSRYLRKGRMEHRAGWVNIVFFIIFLQFMILILNFFLGILTV